MARSPPNKSTTLCQRLHFAGRHSLEQMSRSSFRGLRKPSIPQFQCLPNRLARHREFSDLPLDGLKNLGAGCADILARSPARLANAKKRCHLFERKPEAQGILDQAQRDRSRIHCIHGSLPEYALP